MNNTEILLFIRKWRILLLLVFLSSLVGGTIYLEPYILKYNSTATFYVNYEDINSIANLTDPRQAELMQISVGQERLQQLVYSTEMMKFLIKRFDLYNHYGIDSTKRYHYAKMVKKITQKVSINKINMEFSNLKVSDRNNEMAADIANAAVWKLGQMYKNYFISKLKANLSLYDAYLSEAEHISKDQNTKMISYINALRSQRSGSRALLSEIEFGVYESSREISMHAKELLKLRSIYHKAIHAINQNNVPTITPIKAALPEMKSKKKFLAAGAIAVAVIVTSGVLLLLYGFFYFKKELAIVFSPRNPSEQKPG